MKRKLSLPSYVLSGIPVLMTMLMIAVGHPTQAQTLITLHNFSNGADGSQPFGTLVLDQQGNLYGTAYSGGFQSPNCTVNGIGCGTLFNLTRLRVGWSFNVLYSFKGYPNDGSNPDAESLAFDGEGNIYGTTAFGGDLLQCDNFGCGTVFKLAPDGTETVLHNFHEGGGDALEPFSGLVLSDNGSLFGTTFHGGAYLFGTVYEITSTGTERVLYSFSPGSDGTGPYGGLILDSHGNLYGTTQDGGRNCGAVGCGTVFKLAPDGTETVLYRFAGGADGAEPWAGVVFDAEGNLYGTTRLGGSGCDGAGCGTVFKLAADGTETVLYRFAGGSDGAGPRAAMILDAAGNLYGTTPFGGQLNSCGTVFKLAPDGTETVLHRFNLPDGCGPYGGLVRDDNGVLYGTTQSGGTNSWGTVYEVVPFKKHS